MEECCVLQFLDCCHSSSTKFNLVRHTATAHRSLIVLLGPMVCSSIRHADLSVLGRLSKPPRMDLSRPKFDLKTYKETARDIRSYSRARILCRDNVRLEGSLQHCCIPKPLGWNLVADQSLDPSPYAAPTRLISMSPSEESLIR